MPFFIPFLGGATGTGAAERYLGTWDASTNTPTIVSSTGTRGDYYDISVTGTTNIDGTTSWTAGGEIAFNGSIWEFRPSATALTAPQVKTLYESNADTNALVDAKNTILNGLTIANDRLTSDKSLEVPAGSVLVGSQNRLSSALRTLNLNSSFGGETFVVHTQKFDETSGFEALNSFVGGVVDTVALNDPVGSAISNTAQFTMTASADEVLTKFVVETNQISQSVAFVLTIRTGSHSGPIEFNFDGNATTDASGLATVSLIDDFNPIVVNNGDQLYVSATATGLVGIQSGPDFTPNTTITRIVFSREQVALSSDITSQTQSNWNETDTGAASYIQNKPAIPVARTDEEIRNVIGTALVAGSNISIAVNDAANTITISANPASGGNPPPAPADTIYYGLMDTNIPATVDTATLTTQTDPTNPYETSQVGASTAGQYYVILVPMNDDLTAITGTVNSIDVTDTFTPTDNVRTINTVLYKSYVLGPLNAGVNETYILSFGS